MTEQEHAGPHREGCPLRDGGGLAAAVEAALAKVDRTWGGAAMVVKDTVLSILGRHCTNEFCEHDHAAMRDLRAAADEPSDPPTGGGLHDHAPGLWCDECPDAEEKRAASARGMTVEELRERQEYWRRTDPRRTPTGGTDAGGLAESIALTEDEKKALSRALVAYGSVTDPDDNLADHCRWVVDALAPAIEHIVAAHVEALRDSGRAADGGGA